MGDSKPPTEMKPTEGLALYSPKALKIMERVGPDDPKTFQELIEAGLHVDTCRWVAMHLPKRYAIWWGLICATDASGAEKTDALCDQLMAWVLNPSESIQMKLLNETWTDVPESPMEFLSKAVSWSGKSMLPATLPVVPASAEQFGRMVSACVELSAAKHGQLDGVESIKRFLQFARAIDSGKLSWQNLDEADSKVLESAIPEGLFPLE